MLIKHLFFLFFQDVVLIYIDRPAYRPVYTGKRLLRSGVVCFFSHRFRQLKLQQQGFGSGCADRYRCTGRSAEPESAKPDCSQKLRCNKYALSDQFPRKRLCNKRRFWPTGEKEQPDTGFGPEYRDFRYRKWRLYSAAFFK